MVIPVNSASAEWRVHSGYQAISKSIDLALSDLRASLLWSRGTEASSRVGQNGRIQYRSYGVGVRGTSNPGAVRRCWQCQRHARGALLVRHCHRPREPDGETSFDHGERPSPSAPPCWCAYRKTDLGRHARLEHSLEQLAARARPCVAIMACSSSWAHKSVPSAVRPPRAGCPSRTPWYESRRSVSTRPNARRPAASPWTLTTTTHPLSPNPHRHRSPHRINLDLHGDRLLPRLGDMVPVVDPLSEGQTRYERNAPWPVLTSKQPCTPRTRSAELPQGPAGGVCRGVRDARRD